MTTKSRLPVAAILLVLWAVGAAPPVKAAKPADAPGTGLKPNIHRRGSLDNSRVQLEGAKRGHVAFMGGSITEMNGYRPMVCEILRKRFPDTEFTFTDAGIASTCSTTGAFRLASDVLAKGPVDLFFVEFAVNDDQDAGHARRECIRGMEGIVRHARRYNPNMDIVLTYFVNPGMLETNRSGQTPLTVAAHEEVARHYGVSTIDLAKEVADEVEAGRLTWKEFGGTHPAPRGNRICAGMIDELMQAAWREPLPAEAGKSAHPMPAEPLDPLNYERGRFVELETARELSGWSIGTPRWNELPGSARSRFAAIPMLCGDQPGASLSLPFCGTAIGGYVVAGPDAGTVEAAVDDGPFRQFDLYHRYSRGLHYPRTVVFDADLEPGEHTLRLRIGKARNPLSSGNAARIMKFVAN